MSTVSALAGKTVAELKSMVANAEKILASANVKMHAAAEAFMATARAELSGRRVAGRPGSAPRRDFAAEQAQILAIAQEAAARFDLTAETARARGTRSPHSLLSAKGGLKVGGASKSGTYPVNLYASYKAGEVVINLGLFMPPESDEVWFDAGWFNLKSRSNTDLEKVDGMIHTQDLAEARAAFMAALEQHAPLREAGAQGD